MEHGVEQYLYDHNTHAYFHILPKTMCPIFPVQIMSPILVCVLIEMRLSRGYCYYVTPPRLTERNTQQQMQTIGPNIHASEAK